MFHLHRQSFEENYVDLAESNKEDDENKKADVKRTTFAALNFFARVLHLLSLTVLNDNCYDIFYALWYNKRKRKPL